MDGKVEGQDSKEDHGVFKQFWKIEHKRNMPANNNDVIYKSTFAVSDRVKNFL